MAFYIYKGVDDMSEHTSPANNPWSADAEAAAREIAAQAAREERAAEELAERIAQLRVNALEYVLPVRLPIKGETWAMYRHDTGEDSESIAHEQDRDMQIMVIADSTFCEDGYQPPALRILTKESVNFKVPYLEKDRTVTKHPKAAFLISDIMIYGNGDAQYFFDAFVYRNPTKPDPTYVPIFMVNGEGNQVMSKNCPTTTCYVIDAQIDGEQVTTEPFGHFDRLEDRQHVVDLAERTITALMPLLADEYGIKLP